MMVTPELLLFLAGKMRLPNPIISQYPDTEHRCYLRHGDGLTNVFWPHKDRIQWAAVNGYGPTLEDTYCLAFDKDIRKHGVKNDGTGEGVRDAALEAIALATGWPGIEGGE